MKMTRLEWRYLQRIALDHPYYDTHKPPLSDAEARAIMEANNMMTGREFVDSIYAKLGMTRPVKEKRRLAWLSNIGELFAVPPIRKIAIAILIVLLMTVFFAATPTGRAIAESVIQYFATLFEGGSLVINRIDGDTTVVSTSDEALFDGDDWQEAESFIVYVDSFDDFTKATARKPAVLPLPYIELYYDYDELTEYLKLQSTYETVDGRIVTYQLWNAWDLASTTSKEFTVYNADPSIFYSIEEDGTISVIKILEDSVFVLNAEGRFTLDKLINYMINE